MEIQIVNLLPPDMPYRVTKMKKQMKDDVLYYDVQTNEIQKNCDLYILIAGNRIRQAEQWIQMNQIDRGKVILFVCENQRGFTCWCMPKAFEKEFDEEKMIQMLGCIRMDDSHAELLCSYDLKLMKLHKEEKVVQLEERLKKHCTLKTCIHLFVREKTRKMLNEEGMTMNVHQHWIRGVDSEIEVLFVKRKS